MARHTSTPSLDEVDLLALAPVRRAEWEECEGRVVIRRPPLPGSGLRARLARLMDTRPRSIRLDELGSFVWRRLDGRTRVEEILAAMDEAFPGGEGLAPRVGVFIRTLREHGLVAYPGWD